MEIDRNVNLENLVEEAQKQDSNKNLAWRPFRVSVPEILAMIEDGGEFHSYFSRGGKQLVLINYEGRTFVCESAELLVFLNPEGPDIVSRYIN